MTTTNKHFSASRHIDTTVCLNELLSMEVGQIKEYEVFEGLIRMSVRQGTGRARLYSAINISRDQHHRVYECVRGTGVKRLNDSEAVGAAGAAISRIRNTARRGAKKLACANFDNLSNSDKVKHNMTASFLGVIDAVSSGKAVKRLEAAVGESHELLAAKNSVQHLLNGK